MNICLYIATIIVYIALLNYNKGTNPSLVKMRNCPIHIQILIHDTILQKRLCWNCVACNLSCVYMFRCITLKHLNSLTNIDTVIASSVAQRSPIELQCHRFLVQFLALTRIFVWLLRINSFGHIQLMCHLTFSFLLLCYFI